jgi:hypothetical protein
VRCSVSAGRGGKGEGHVDAMLGKADLLLDGHGGGEGGAEKSSLAHFFDLEMAVLAPCGGDGFGVAPRWGRPSSSSSKLQWRRRCRGW